eukprot:scaffold121_cov356-Pavlova_lutheri.AAC.11
MKCLFDLGHLSWYSSPELACQRCGPSFRAPHMEPYPYALGSKQYLQGPSPSSWTRHSSSKEGGPT